MRKRTIVATSQKEVFPCCICEKQIDSFSLFLSLGCHIECAGLLVFNNVAKKKPKLGETVLVFEQGYGEKGNYYYSYKIAMYIKQPNDKRKKVFANALAVEIKSTSPWIYSRVTHWMYLTKPTKVRRGTDGESGTTPPAGKEKGRND